jgi:uncharacterized phosphosugar-binding protein
MTSTNYFNCAIETLQRIAETQKANIAAAADLIVEAIVSEHSMFSFGASHSFIVTEELVYRAGGLMLINPILPHAMNLFVRPLTATSKMERLLGFGKELLNAAPIREGDLLILASVSGRNPVVIDMALTARERKIKIIGITSLAYSKGVTSRHPSGKKLPDLCDVVLDNGAPYGDAALPVEGFAEKVGPLSSVASCAIANAMVCEVVDKLVKRGIEPPVFRSANCDEGEAYNVRLLDKYRDRIHYLE